ncbi:MAG: hypothetical protein K2O96_06360 [Lachnospiraceae bacterium]|nr:hypothetical protein [Lachnospiraceae bacterium]
MAINGINSYGRMGYYDYQSSINNVRLAQALSRNQRYSKSPVSQISPVKGPLKDSMNFMKTYNSTMSNLMSAANTLRGGNSSSVMNDLTVTSSNEAVATATEKLNVRNAKDITLDVTQLAQAQTNVSAGVKATDAATEDMNFSVGNGIKSVNVNVSAVNEDGSSKTNAQMLREAADQINSGSANVKASIVEKDGTATLKLTGTYTGAANGFQVSGDLGAAKGLDAVQTEAANSIYSVTTNGKTTKYESYSNEISVDSTRIGVSLKSVGKTTISAGVDVNKTVSAVEDLVKAYNSSLKLLNDNYDRGTGVDNQLRNLVRGLGSDKSLEQLGITVNKDATLKLDKDVLAKNLKEQPSLTRDLISGTGGIANTAFNKASSAMAVNSSTLINNDIESAQAEAMNSSYHAFNMYSRNGAYALNNYCALGMMMNYLV